MNELARRPLPHMTADEFLLWPGDGTRRKFHLIDGDVVAMAPASSTHGAIQANLAFLMTMAIRSRGLRFQVVTEGAVVPALTARDNVRIPDVVVMRGRTTSGEVAIPSPVVIAEILSPGNASVTRENARAYATLASVQEIVVVASTRMEVEVNRRDKAGAWLPDPDTIKPGERLTVSTIGLDCALEEVYAGTWLVEPAP